MRIVTYLRIKEFAIIHHDAKISLEVWYHTIKNRDWQNLAAIKNDFKSVDYVGNFRYVFNIKGNKYRLVCIISFNAKKVYIRFIGTHSEYDRITDIKNI